MKTVTFITGNPHKVDFLNEFLGVTLKHHALDLDEIQSLDMREVIMHKAKQAYEHLQKPVLVDDVSMGLEALGGLPGPFIKHFVQVPDGAENICRMADGLKSRRATACAYFGLYDGEHMVVMNGEIHGTIADHPRGENGFAYGWDKVFCPDGYDGRTRAELTQVEYEAVYRAIRPITQLKTYLES